MSKNPTKAAEPGQAEDAADAPGRGVKRALVAAAALSGLAAAAVAVTGAASATPGAGISGVTLASGTVAERVHLRSHGNEQTDVLVQELTIAPGGTSGWHTHPGPAVVVVESGVFTLRSERANACVNEQYGPGQAFVDPGHGHRHLGLNLGDEPVVVTVIYLLPAGSAGPRIDVPQEDVPRACAS